MADWDGTEDFNQWVLRRFQDADWTPPDNIVWVEEVKDDDSDCWVDKHDEQNPPPRPEYSLSSAPEVLNAKQVAGLLNCNIKTVYEWTRKGEIPVTKVGGVKRGCRPRYVYSRDAILAWLRGQT